MPADAAVATPTPAPVPAAAVSSPAPAPAAAPASPAAAAPAATPAAPAPPAAPAAAADPKAADGAPARELPKIVPSIIGGKEEDATKAPDAPQTDAAPVYEFKMPEGVELDAPMLDSAKAIFAKGKVAPEIAQELVGLQTSALKTIAEDLQHKLAVRQIEVWNEMQLDWKKQALEAPDIGGNDLTKLASFKIDIENGLQKMFGIGETTPDGAKERQQHSRFIAALGIAGAGNNPEILRFLAKATAPYREAKDAAQGNPPSAPKKSFAEVMYPTKQAAE